MPDLPDIDELTKDLEPQAKAVVKALYELLSNALSKLE